MKYHRNITLDHPRKTPIDPHHNGCFHSLNILGGGSSGMAYTGLILDITGIIYGLEKSDCLWGGLLKTFHLHVEKNSSVGLQ